MIRLERSVRYSLWGADNVTSADTITGFAQAHHASLTIMDDGEHWLRTEDQTQFLDNWIKKQIG